MTLVVGGQGDLGYLCGAERSQSFLPPTACYECTFQRVGPPLSILFCCFLRLPLVKESDLKLRAVHFFKLASAISQPSRGKQQEELVQSQSLNGSIELKRAPLSDTSLTVHERRQVPSIAIICADNGRSKVTCGPSGPSVFGISKPSCCTLYGSGLQAYR